MTSRDEVIGYFQKKKALWIDQDGSVEMHVRNLQSSGLSQEFNGDRPEFDKVCQYARELSAFQVTPLPEKIEDLIGNVLGFPVEPTVDVVLGGIDIACGFKKTGNKLLKVGIGILGTIGLVALLSAIFGGGND